MTFDFMDVALALVAGYALGLALGHYWQQNEERKEILALEQPDDGLAAPEAPLPSPRVWIQ